MKKVTRMRSHPLAALGLLLIPCITAPACCSVSPPGMPVRFGDQSNIIIWNPAVGIEHFVRKAMFTTKATNFGFIAPTPSRPDLSEASERAFTTLARLAPPPPDQIGCGRYDVAGATASNSAVNVIQEADVAGYHATTLLASDSKVLAAWMTKNGYRTTPGIQKWTAFYIAKDWYLTAFKVKNEEVAATTGTVRLSFKTPEPFNPYYVPDDNIDSQHKGTLKVFFVAPEPYAGRIGGKIPWVNAHWSVSLEDGPAAELADELKLSKSDIPKGASVELFNDYNFPTSGADDVYFTPDRRFPWWKAIVTALVLAAVAWRLLRRRKQPEPESLDLAA